MSWLYNWFMDFVPKVKWHKIKKKIWGYHFNIELSDWPLIEEVLDTGYFIILTADKCSLSSWGVKALHFALTGKFASYSHALVNVEGEPPEPYKFVEALNAGVKASTFIEVFSCDAVCILKPKYYSLEQLNATVGEAMVNIGKKYDKKFNYQDDAEMSCVEVARARLKSLPNYETEMRVFEHMIKTEKNLTPQMFRDCPDFEVLLEIKR